MAFPDSIAIARVVSCSSSCVSTRLVKIQTLVQNALKYMALSRGVSLASKLTTQRGQALMLALAFPAVIDQQRDQMIDLLRQLSAKIKPVQEWLAQQAEEDVRVRRVMTHPGIGPLTGLCLVNTLLPVNRFSNPRKVSAYIGFDPVEDSSADRRRMGAISKAGSRLLRYLLIEAGQTAVRRDPALEESLRRVQQRRNRPKPRSPWRVICWFAASSCCAMKSTMPSFFVVARPLGLPEKISRL